MCDVCGVQWRRSQLIRKADGTLCCPDDAPGRDLVTLAEGNAMAADSRKYGNTTRDGANWDHDEVVAINPRSIPSLPTQAALNLLTTETGNALTDEGGLELSI